LLANADAATFNLLRRGWFIPADNIGRIVYRTQRRRSEARPAVVTKVLGRLLQLVSREEVERQLDGSLSALPSDGLCWVVSWPAG
jgi:hypothetical protein